MKIRRLIAIWTAKMISALCRISGREGVTLAGKAALKIDPSILEELSSQVREKIFVVCGTNGKTTTNNLLCAAIEAEGKKLVCNRTGSNMLQGVVAAFVLAADWNGKLNVDYACLEVDEASAQYIFPQMKPDYMILTNLFRDQLDRYGEIDTTMELLNRAVKTVPEMTVIVNGDDPLSAYLVMEGTNPYLTFGIAEKADAATDEAAKSAGEFSEKKQLSHEVRDGGFCKKCGARLEYDFYHYGQLGEYHCTKCSFAHPETDFEAAAVDLSNGLTFDIKTKKDAVQHVSVNYRGFYNIYNILAAYSVLEAAGMDTVHFVQTLHEFHPQNGRMESFMVNGCKVTLNLAKNPAGFNQNIEAMMSDQEEKDIIIAINDNAADGTDVSWLWDVDFDQMKDQTVKSITACGIRCLDMQLRLKYVGIEADTVADIKAAIEQKTGRGSGNLYVLVNYTALFSTRKLLEALSASS